MDDLKAEDLAAILSEDDGAEEPAPKEKISHVVEMDRANLEGRGKEFGGALADKWNSRLATQLGMIGGFDADKCEAEAGCLYGIKPQDEFEGMVATQMIAAHNAAMDCFRRAGFPEQYLEARNMYLNQANKLLRTYSTLLATLDKHRGKGQQKVTVEHVHVHEGGQAIVGNVEGKQPGGENKNGVQPHAKAITNAPGAAMPCDIETDREKVPSASC